MSRGNSRVGHRELELTYSFFIAAIRCAVPGKSGLLSLLLYAACPSHVAGLSWVVRRVGGKLPTSFTPKALAWPM